MKNSLKNSREKSRCQDARSLNPGKNLNCYPASLWNQEKAGGMLALLSQPAVEKDGEQQLPFLACGPYNRRGAAGDEQKREEE